MPGSLWPAATATVATRNAIEPIRTASTPAVPIRVSPATLPTMFAAVSSCQVTSLVGSPEPDPPCSDHQIRSFLARPGPLRLPIRRRRRGRLN